MMILLTMHNEYSRKLIGLFSVHVCVYVCVCAHLVPLLLSLSVCVILYIFGYSRQNDKLQDCVGEWMDG